MAMVLMTLERSRAAHRADFALYGTAALMLAAIVLTLAPRGQGTALAASVLTGAAGWATVECLLDRWVRGGLQPFRAWHARQRHPPMARLCTPTWLSATLFIALVFLPALAVAGVWHASAAMLGVLLGDLACTLAHHALHHRQVDGTGLRPWPGRRGVRLALMQLKHGAPRSA